MPKNQTKVDYRPGQTVEVRLGHDWYKAEVVKSNKKTVVVRTLFSKTKYRKVSMVPDDAGVVGDVFRDLGVVDVAGLSRLEPYTVSGTKVVKLPRVKVRPLEGMVVEEPEPPPLVDYLEELESEPEPWPEPVEDIQEPDLVDQLHDTKEALESPEPVTGGAADVLAELEKMLG